MDSSILYYSRVSFIGSAAESGRVRQNGYFSVAEADCIRVVLRRRRMLSLGSSRASGRRRLLRSLTRKNVDLAAECIRACAFGKCAEIVSSPDEVLARIGL